MSNIEPNIDPMSIPGFVLWQVSKLWQRALTNALRPFHIGSTEFVVLGNAVRLSQLGKQATPAMLMEAAKIDRMTASQTLRSLGKKGLIERAGISEDKRTFHVVPTKAGIRLADEALGGVIQAHAAFFAPLQGRSEQFLKTMQDLIEGGSSERIA
jgi:DNA-binding MarR family transcriptional regulator